MAGCGHGECTVEGNCKYEQEVTGLRWKQNDGSRQPDGVRWTAADLDRCEHGRHSIDNCADCGGMSGGNGYLTAFVTTVDPSTGDQLVRIGTMVRGEPIWACPRRSS